jgi:integrase
MERLVFPVFGQLGVDKVTVKEVLAVVEPLWTVKHDTGSRLRGAIEQVLDYAKAMKQRDGENPAQWKGNLSGILAKPKRVKGEKVHLAALPWEQVPQFIAKLRARDGVAARALEFTILTCSRSNEVRDMKWREVDFEKRVWTIPAERMKARREHAVPLCARALAILEGLKRTEALIFPIGRDGMIDVVKELAGDYTTHGFRSAFSSWAGEATTLPRDIVERCLAHATGSQVEQAYRRGQELERRARVLAAWEQFVANGIKPAAVVDIRRAS